MLWNSLMKKPVFVMGLAMFLLFLYQVSKKQSWGLFHNEKLISNACKGAMVPLVKRIPNNWQAMCEGNNLAVEIREVAIPDQAPNLKNLMYRQLANHMSYVARSSPPDILEKVFFVRFKLIHPKMNIDAVTEGKYIVKLATLDTSEHIMTHLKSSVQVKETVK